MEEVGQPDHLVQHQPYATSFRINKQFMRYLTVTTFQLVLLVLLMSIITTAFGCGFLFYMHNKMLPEVYLNGEQCVKVVNYENGHAFGCQDVGVLLRQYRVVSAAS